MNIEVKHNFNVWPIMYPIICSLFVAAKLFGFLDWSWLWVTAPIWGTLLFSGVVALLFGVILGFFGLLPKKKDE